MSDEFFAHKREWSRFKHSLLRRYLGQFAGIVGSTNDTVYYIDGFAGEGRYKDPPEDGSPVIAARIAYETDPRRKHTLRCINIEPEHFEGLCASTAQFGDVLVQNKRGTFREHLPWILNEIQNKPALFFLDPMCHKGMEWDVVSQLARRAGSAITEVLLNFYVSRIDVFAGYLTSTDQAASAFVRGLDELFGTTEWQPIASSGASKEERMLKLSDLYMHRLHNEFARQSANALAARYAVRSLEGDLKYHIIYGTRHRRGGTAMSDSVYRVNVEYEKAKAQKKKDEQDATGQSSLFDLEAPRTDEQVNAQIVSELVIDLLANAPRGKAFRLIELQDLFLPDWFGRAVEKHFRGACKQIVKDKKAEIIKARVTKTRDPLSIGASDRIKLIV